MIKLEILKELFRYGYYVLITLGSIFLGKKIGLYNLLILLSVTFPIATIVDAIKNKRRYYLCFSVIPIVFLVLYNKLNLKTLTIIMFITLVATIIYIMIIEFKKSKS